MQIIRAFLSIFLIVIFLIGCENTIHGFGKDLEKNGNEIQKSSSN